MPAGNSLFFVDTNLLLYRLDASDRAKQTRATAWLYRLWSSGSGRISWQVLHEYYWNATRKLKAPIRVTQDEVRQLATWHPVGPSLELLERAWSWSDRADVPYWDGLILAAAERAGAAYILSEDFQAGRRFGDCTVVNPFTVAPEILMD